MDKNLVFLVLFSVLLSGVIYNGLPNSPAYAIASITLSPESGKPGSTVTVSGSEFPPNREVDIQLEGESVQTVTVESDGTFVTSFTVPESKLPGDYNVIATTSGATALASFTVTTVADVTLTPTSGIPGATITLEGTKFTPNKRITITFDDNTVVTSPSSITTDNTGAFSATFNVPASAGEGRHTVSVTDDSNRVDLIFTVGASIVLTPTESAVSATVTVEGAGFDGNREITIKFDDNTVTTSPTTITTTSTGTFSATFVIATGTTTGSHTVSATDGTNTATADFDVGLFSTAAISPDSGAPGVVATISGSGFTQDSAITIKFDGTTLDTTPASIAVGSTGAFSATVTIPADASPGSHNISVTDADGNSTSITFIITTSGTITLTPDVSIEGSTVTISGSNFTPGSNVNLMFDSTELMASPVTITVSESGGFEATITIPNGVAIGDHTITATDDSGRTATAELTVTVAGEITVNPTDGLAGTKITIQGSNFVGGKKITIKFGDTVLSTFPPNVVAGGAGAFVATSEVPLDVTGGGYTITATDETGRLGIASFTVPGGGATISLSPTNGSVGTVVTITGSSFTPNAQITIKFDGSIITTDPVTVTATGTGTFEATITVPSTAATGGHTVSAAGSSRAASSVFNIGAQTGQSSITLSSTSATTGSALTVEGSNFDAGSSITIKLDNIILATSVTTSEGTFMITFNVPTSISDGSHSVSATDGTNTASASVSITGGIQSVLELSRLEMVDIAGSSVGRPSVGMQILIQSDLRNSLSTDQEFVYIVQVKDSGGSTVMIAWMSGTLPASKRYAVAQSWLIEESGSYDVEIFTWESLLNPTVLAPSLKTTVNVS